MNKILLLALLVLAIHCGRPPAPVCRPSPLPSVIPVSIGETVRIDLENLFDGYNLVFDGLKKDHIQITPKYTVNQTTFEHSFNFTAVKIKEHNRFLGLTAFNDYTELAIGTNHPESGVTIEKVIQIEDIPELHCFDVDEIVERTSHKAYAIIDCGSYRMGQLHRNQFLFVDLSTYKLVLGSRTSDVFVRYNHLIKRRIETITNPFTNVEYLFRFYTTQGVDQAHADQTYVEVFMNSQNIMKIQIVDVIDHTLLGLPSLAIYDFQVHFNYIYLLVKDSGLYQIELTPTQRLIRRSFFPIKMNVNRFVVEQNGFNDDLHLVFSNDNTIYQFVWDVTVPPVLVTKYALMANSVVEDLLVDESFVIAQVWETVNGEKERRTWIFSRRTLSYTNAFGSFKEPSFGPSFILYQPMDRTLHLIHEYRTMNIKLNLPYLINNPASSQKAGDSQQYLIRATSSTGENGTSTECRQTLKFVYIENTDTSIIKTGLQGRNQTYVDAPDDAEFNLQYEFFGRNLSYNVITNNVDNKTNSTVVPEAYVEKYVKTTFNFPVDIDQKNIVYFEMFLESSLEEVDDRNQIYGVVQVQETANSFPIHYIVCQVQTDAEYVNPVLKCRTINKSNLSMGKILSMSQMYSPKQRMAAMVFSNDQSGVYLYEFEPTGFHYYGHKKFSYNFYNKMTGVEVTMKGQLIVTFEYAKRIEVYKIQDIRHDQEKPAVPLMTIDSRVMAFFGVEYFSPIKTKISIYHDEVTFLQTKTGVMAININQLGFPQLLFHIRSPTSKFDFEVNRDTLVVITETYMAMYRLTTPLRRRQQPFLLQKYNSDFNLNEYDEINSDGLFYLVEKQDTMLLVVHPNMPSTSVIYTEFYIKNIKMIDAVRIHNNEVLFVFNGTNMLAWMFAESPRLRIRWQPSQVNFTMNVTAFNEKARSQPYSTLFSIVESDEAEIKPTPKFNTTAIRRSGYVQAKKNNKKIVDLNITLNDTQWFTGNVMHYYAKCQHCNRNASDHQFQISLQNHLKQLNTEIKVGEPVYDMHSTFTGIYGQMYDSIFKTFPQNDSVDYIVKIPTISRGQVCTKLAVNPYQDYVLSFCESGAQVNIYITTSASSKPFISGPFQTEAEAVNHVEIVNNIIMIVDNDDDPFNRAGGVYLYYLNLSAKNPADVLTMLDFIDNEDLQIEGFRGMPFIASADFHKPLFNRDEYSIFITEARTGNIFVFLFQLSANKQEAVYLQKRMLELNRLIPQSVKHPTPLRVININIIDYTVRTQTKMRIEYVLLLTVRNWHHIQLMFVFDEDYDLLSFELVRLYQRVPYPWELANFIRLRKGSINASYFAVSYRDYNQGSQFVVVYELPYFSLPAQPAEPKAGIPITRMLAGHRVMDTAEMCYDFNTRDQHRILFNDVSTPHLSELELNRQLKLLVKNADPTQIEGENITIIAENHYTNLSFVVEFKFNFDKDDDDDDDKEHKTEIIWIIILVIGFVVIVGLIFAWSRQNKNSVSRDSAAIKESLLTVEPEFKTNYINRSSVDPESVRGTVDYTSPAEEQKKMQREEDEGKQGEEIESPEELKTKEGKQEA